MSITRRKFLSKGVLAASSMALPAPFVWSRCTAGTSPLGVGIIGMGDRGTGLASLIQNIPSIKLVAYCDVLPFRLTSAKQQVGEEAKAYAGHEALLEDKNVQAVIIATPFNSHADIAIDALNSGKHVYCEKTLAYGIEENKKLVSAAEASKKIFQTGHQYHSSRLYHHIVDIIKKGYIGELSMIESQWNRNGDWRRPVPDPKWERMVNWRMYREYSGGLVAELCSHQIDFSNWLTGQVPQKVTGFGGVDYWKDGRETYDNVHIITEYPSGLKATYTCLTTNAKDDYQIKILGKEGTIIVNYEKAWVYLERSKIAELGTVDGVSSATVKSWENGEGTPIDVEHKNPTLQALLDFQEAVRTGQQPLSNVVSGANAAIVVQMALDAMDHDQVQYWKEEYNF